jgi:hypothetical protein
MKYCAYGYVAIAAFNLLFNTHAPGGNAGGDAAHIGGALAGFFFIKHSHLLTDFFDVLSDSRRVKARAAKATSGTDGEVDRVLAKVATQGLQSLSEGEKRILSSETQRQQRRSRSA